MLRSVHNKAKVSSLLIPATRTADANSSSIDVKDHGSAAILFHIGNSGDTLSGSVKIELELEHSDDNSTWSDCADADLSAAVTGTNTGTAAVIDDGAEDSLVVKVGYLGNKRYVRGVLNFTGTHTNGCPCAVLAIQGDAEVEPV